MNRTIEALGMGVVVLCATSAWADRFVPVTVEEAKACEKEFPDGRQWNHAFKPLIVDAIKAGKISEGCKALIQKGVPTCLNNPQALARYEEEYNKGNEAWRQPKGKKPAPAAKPAVSKEDYCAQISWNSVYGELFNAGEQAKAEEAKKKAEEEKKKKMMDAIAVAELPKATKKDPAVEKQIAAAYAKQYKNKSFKVLLVGDWITDRNALGAITGRHIQGVVVNEVADPEMVSRWGTNGRYCELHSEAWQQEYRGGKFVGPLTAAGGGSMSKDGILCEKAEGKKK